MPQTAALKVPAIPSNGQFRKDTKIGHFLKFFKGGPRENRSKSRPNSQVRKKPCRKSHPQLISMRLKCNHRTTFVPQTAALKVPAIPSNGQFRKDTKIGHFFKFFKGGPRENRSKSRPNSQVRKKPCRKSHPQLISMRLKCNHRTTLCRKPRL